MVAKGKANGVSTDRVRLRGVYVVSEISLKSLCRTWNTASGPRLTANLIGNQTWSGAYSCSTSPARRERGRFPAECPSLAWLGSSARTLRRSLSPSAGSPGLPASSSPPGCRGPSHQPSRHGRRIHREMSHAARLKNTDRANTPGMRVISRLSSQAASQPW